MNLILLGLPGAGKGTHSKKLSKQFDMAHLSSGNLIRKMAKQKYLNRNRNEKMYYGR